MKSRNYALDVFRGATVAFMILVNNPGSWEHTYSPLQHAGWHGLTPTDLVFPFFLFAVGNALAFVMPRLEAAGPALFWKKVLKRTALIFAIGLFLNWSPFVQWTDGGYALRGWTWVNAEGEIRGIRIMGVLQRIALCYLFAAVIIYYTKTRGSFFTGLLLLLLYWAICFLGNPADPYSLQGWAGTGVDKAILGEAHLYRGEGVPFDPEGLVSTLPAVVNVLFGFLAGDYIRRRNLYLQEAGAAAGGGPAPIYQTLAVLLLSAAALLFAGYVWGYLFPVNKKIWTSSYVCITVGLAMTTLAVLIYFTEIRKARGWWTRFFGVFGKNALAIYALSGLIPDLLSLIRIKDGVGADGALHYTDPWAWFYEHVCARVPGAPQNGSLLFALSVVALLWVIGYRMDKRGIYIKV